MRYMECQNRQQQPGVALSAMATDPRLGEETANGVSKLPVLRL